MGSPWLGGSPQSSVMAVAAGHDEMYAGGAGGAAGVVTEAWGDQGPVPALLLQHTLPANNTQ